MHIEGLNHTPVSLFEPSFDSHPRLLAENLPSLQQRERQHAPKEFVRRASPLHDLCYLHERVARLEEEPTIGMGRCVEVLNI